MNAQTPDVAPGTSVLVSSPQGTPVAFMRFNDRGELPSFQGNAAEATPSITLAFAYLWARGQGIINADGTFVDETREEGL